jgi:HEAT repeat protein
MNRLLKSSLATAGMLVLGAGVALADHCNSYRGPVGQVPPTGRTPNDPTAPPGGGSTPGGSAGGGQTGGGTNPGGGPTVGPRSPSGGGTGGGNRGGGATPGPRGRKSDGSEGFERWEFWWEYNKDAHLNLKASLAQRAMVSGSSDFLLGRENRDAVSNITKPTEKMIKAELVPALLKALDDPYFLVRDAAVLAIAKAGDKSVLPAIEQRLSDQNRDVQESAVIALGILGEKDAVPTLLHILKQTAAGKKLLGASEIRPELRAFAAVALGLIGDEGTVPTLVALTKTKEARKDVPVAATVALGLMKAQTAVGELTRLLREPDTDEFVRSYAASSLGKIGDRSAVPALIDALRDKSIHVSRSAVVALGLLVDKDQDPKAVKELVDVLSKGSDVQIRGWSCIALGQIGGADARKALLNALEKERRSLQAFAALGLAIMQKKSPEADVIGYVRTAFGEAKEHSVRSGLAMALGIAGDTESEKALVEVVRSGGSPDLRGYAAVALGLMKARSAMPDIEALLKENQNKPDLARSAAIALGLMGDRNVISILTDALKNATVDEVRGSAALALGQIGDVSAIEPLISLISAKPGSTERSRAFAAVALGIIGEDQPLPVLSRLSRDNNYRAQIPSIKTLLDLL